ncbi:hypothetical protein DPMN_024548 [Dreissena polymorpha]|uniref:Uncharacterized protein n=1 Tax=Dreissena polymorpha TaxID=45954 RepID=A0A9D4RCS9_DREPO|nr:hypothetical protein DPMN_024548 [Dreissena polymorpha]
MMARLGTLSAHKIASATGMLSPTHATDATAMHPHTWLFDMTTDRCVQPSILVLDDN